MAEFLAALFFQMSHAIVKRDGPWLNAGAVERDNRVLRKRNRWSFRAGDEKPLRKLNGPRAFAIFVDLTWLTGVSLRNPGGNYLPANRGIVRHCYGATVEGLH